MRNFFRIHDVGIKEILVIGLILLAGYTVWLHKQLVQATYQKVASKVEQTLPWPQTVIDRCGEDCQKEIDKRVGQALATGSAKTAAGSVAKTGSSTKTSTLSVGSTFSTTNTDWTDVPGNVYVDPAGYGATRTFYWEGSIKIADGNGEARARLYDATNNIAVNNSEISTSSPSFTTVGSAALPFWAGSNLYKVQLKSSSSQTASFVSGAIKIIYQ